MSRSIEILLVLSYNLILLFGACYLIVVHDWSAWTLLLVLVLAASWDKEPKITVETGK